MVSAQILPRKNIAYHYHKRNNMWRHLRKPALWRESLSFMHPFIHSFIRSFNDFMWLIHFVFGGQKNTGRWIICQFFCVDYWKLTNIHWSANSKRRKKCINFCITHAIWLNIKLGRYLMATFSHICGNANASFSASSHAQCLVVVPGPFFRLYLPRNKFCPLTWSGDFGLLF